MKKWTIDQWIGQDETEPKVKDFYALCRALGITMEQGVDGEQGQEYVRSLMREAGDIWEPPERLRGVVDYLKTLDDREISIV